jgi:hypothetical protein
MTACHDADSPLAPPATPGVGTAPAKGRARELPATPATAAPARRPRCAMARTPFEAVCLQPCRVIACSYHCSAVQLNAPAIRCVPMVQAGGNVGCADDSCARAAGPAPAGRCSPGCSTARGPGAGAAGPAGAGSRVGRSAQGSARGCRTRASTAQGRCMYMNGVCPSHNGNAQ